MRPYAALLALTAGGAAGAEGGLGPVVIDPEIQKMVVDVSAERIERSIFVLTSFRTRHTLSDGRSSGDEIGGAGSWIRAEFERASAPSRGRLRVELDQFRQPAQPPLIPRTTMIVNIVATLPSSAPAASHSVYVICAHYDSRSKDILDHHSAAPGADDNASGVAAVLEAARVMCPFDFGATLIFLITAGEEQGLNGAAHWAEQAKRDGLRLAGVLNVDTIGNTRGPDGRRERHSVRLFAQGLPAGQAANRPLADSGQNDTPPRELARTVRELALLYAPNMGVRTVYRVDRYTRQGDQLAFLERGIPAVRLTEAVEDFGRQNQYVEMRDGRPYGDTADSIDTRYVAGICQVHTAALAGLGRAPAPPRSAELETERRENDATVRWDDPERGVAGYRVVWRETTAPFWQHSADFAPDITRARLPGVGPDDWIFGVEAFDAAGHVSPAVFAAPTKG